MTWDVCRVIFAIRELLCDMPADGPIIAIATSAGDLAVYTVNEMRRLYYMSNITALLMPHELMSCPDFTGHVIISITPAHSPVSPAGSSVSDARPINQPFLLLGLSCGIVVVVETGIFYLVPVSLSAIVVLSVSCISIGITTTVLIIFSQPLDRAREGRATFRSHHLLFLYSLPMIWGMRHGLDHQKLPLPFLAALLSPHSLVLLPLCVRQVLLD